MQVIKRDGRLADFNIERIVKAITLAMSQTPGGVDVELANKIAKQVEKSLGDKKQASVYEIQDLVEKKIMVSSRKEVAQSYITYRYNRDIARKSRTKEVFLDIISAKSNEITRENANMNAEIPSGMMMKFASETTKPFVDDFLLSIEARQAVKDGFIYIHDKDYYPTKSLTCLQHPLDKILENGFKAGNGASRPAKKIEAASVLSCISLETVQSEMHGVQSIPAFDFYLAPYVKKTYIEEIKKIEKLLEKDLSKLYNIEIQDYIKKDITELKNEEKAFQAAINATVDRVHQSMEAFIHNMNTMHLIGGNQVVFSSINYGTDTSAEGRCIIREILLTTERGVGNNETPVFPIQIWKKKKGINYLPTDKNYDLYKLSCRVAEKRFFPNYLNLDATFNIHPKWNEKDSKRYLYECATMGCRTRVFKDRHGETTSIGRGNLSSTTINLPGIAIQASLEAQEKMGIKIEFEKEAEKNITRIYKKNVKKIFKNKLENYAEIVAKQLFDRYKFQCTGVAKQFPLLMSGLWKNSDKLKPNDLVENVLKHGTLGIGFIGLAEALIILTGKHHGESEEAQELGIEIINELNELVNEFSERYDLNYVLLATPDEGILGRFARIDKNKYGIILGVTDKEYYTNGNHVPIYFKCTAQQKAKIEAPYHKLTEGGNIFCIELDENKKTNIAETVVELMDKNDIGYGSINYVKSKCMSCGFEHENTKITKCPICESEEIDTIQRISDYLVGTTAHCNRAKILELRDRVGNSI